MSNLAVGLVGAGGYARAYARHIDRVAGDLAAGALACVGQYVHAGDTGDSVSGATVHHEIEPLLDQLAEAHGALLIPTPIHTHRQLTIAALRSGLHVLCEKPIAGSYADALAMAHASESAQRVLAIGYQFAYLDSTWRALEALRAGQIGDIESVDMLTLWPRNGDYFRRSRWVGRIRHDGVEVRDAPLNNGGAHFLHLALMYADASAQDVFEADRLSGEQWRVNEIESADTQRVDIELASGCRVRAFASHAVDRYYGPVVRVRGTRGSFEWRLADDQHLSYRMIDAAGELILAGEEKADLASALRTLYAAVAGEGAGAGAGAETARRRIGEVTGYALAQSAVVEQLVETTPIADVPPEATGQWRPEDDIYVGPTRTHPVLFVKGLAAEKIAEFESR